MTYYKIFLTVIFTLFATMIFAEDENIASFRSHKLYLKIDVPSQSVKFSDNGLLIIKKGPMVFKINKTANIEHFSINSKDVAIVKDVPFEDSAFARITFESDLEGMFPFTIIYTAVFNDEVENVRFSNENVGREVEATILEKGAYLSGVSYFYPQGDETRLKFTVTADIPSNWESVCDGNKLEQRIEGDRKIQNWENPYQSDGLMFMAAPYVIKSTMFNDIEVACYFFEEDTSLFDGYLSATVEYMNMYTDMIGTYPYNSFIVAENFFPTGYGMPGWTLLGQQVIRLPFIKFTSLGHEVLHNWWGNSVYVDYERGNWCEAAAVYGADYHYKLQRSEDAAKNYRKDILKQYVSYVDEGNDFPIAEFKSRTSPGTRTIGYNKAMMVYHMIEQEIGSESFWDSWKTIYSKYRNKHISWDEWINEFQLTSGKDLSHIIPQWINEKGAPVISLSDINISNNENSKRVTFKLSESSGQEFNLLVPVRFSGENYLFDTTVSLNNNEQIYQLVASSKAEKIEIDPDYHLFRKLYPEEVEPIISAVLGYDNRIYAADLKDSALTSLYTDFGTNMEEEAPEIVYTENVTNDDSDKSLVLLNPENLPAYLNGKFIIDPDSIYVSGQAFPKEGYSFILTGDDFAGFEKYMVVVTSDFETLPRIGQLIPHYGKYSYLVFEGGKNVAKGQWDISASPLKAGL